MAKFFCALLVFPFLLIAEMQEVAFEGIAIDQRGEFAYKEVHKQIFENNTPIQSSIEYYSQEGTLIAKVDSVFTFSPYMPSYNMQNYRRDKEERVEALDNGEIKLAVRPARQKEFLNYTLHAKQPLLIGEGLYFYLQDQLVHLQPTSVLAANLLLASRFQQVAIHIYPLQWIEEGQRKEVVLQIRVTSLLARIIAPPMTVTFDRVNKRLLSFEGIAPIRNQHSHLQKVKVRYTYP
jgi:hypothetical protein